MSIRARGRCPGSSGSSIVPLTLLATISAAGCAKAPPLYPTMDASTGEAQFPDAALPTGPPSVWGDQPAAALFGTDHVPQFEFTVPAGQWQWLQANAALEQYVPAQATYEGQPAGLSGLRFKGNYGTLKNCLDAKQNLICAKLSFKVSFEEYDATNRFFGLKKVNLHSMIHDPTKLHEKLAYELYRSSDIAAPRSTWANVKVNGKSYGLFSLVEEIDGRFTADRWPANGEGNLYKEAWPTVAFPSYYVERLATNKTTADARAIVAFAQDLLAAPAGDGGTSLEKWMDLDALSRYLAVDDAIVNCDGITAFYAPGATGPAWGNHNFYLYQEQNREFFWLVPWDMDATFSTCPWFAQVPRWNALPSDCADNYGVWGGAWVKAPGCDRFFQAVAADRSGYRAAVDTLLGGPFAVATMLEKIDLWAAFIRAAVGVDPTGPGATSWMAAVQDLKATVPILRQRLMGLRDGTSTAPPAP